MFYGLDVHKDFIQVCQVDREGRRRKEFRLDGVADTIEAFAQSLGPRDQVVLEATFHSWAIWRRLRPHAGRVVVANPLQVKAIAHARIKTDKIDAYILAQLLRTGFIPEVQMPEAETWELRQLVSHRRHLVKHRVALKNAIHGLLNRRLLHYEGSQLFNGPGRRWLAGLELEPAERFLLDNMLQLLEATEASVAAVDAQLLERASFQEEVKLLMTIPGVDVTVASGLVAAIGDISRFASPRKLASYFGLVPRVSQSAGRCFHGRITKSGNSGARHLAIEASHSLARSSSPLSATYHRLRRKRGHNVAVTALARKLVVVVWHLLTTRQPYRYGAPTRNRTKLRAVTPNRRRALAGGVPKTLEAVYAEAALPALAPATPGERRSAMANRRTVARLKKATAARRSRTPLTNS